MEVDEMVVVDKCPEYKAAMHLIKVAAKIEVFSYGICIINLFLPVIKSKLVILVVTLG
jgi:hypothetical protein